MLADLAYRRVDFQDAAVHFSALLTRHPSYWVALARLIEVKRRTAQLDEARPFLTLAAQAAANEPGLSYCTGKYFGRFILVKLLTEVPNPITNSMSHFLFIIDIA